MKLVQLFKTFSLYFAPLLIGLSTAKAQQTVKGTVQSSTDQKPLIGVTVNVKHSSRGTVTDNQGHYQITGLKSNDTLVFSFIGYVDKVEEVKNRERINVLLVPSATALDKLIVVGYGTQKKGNLTGAVSSISSKELSAFQVNDLGQALQGRMPGLNLSIADGKPGREANFNIRGTTSINGGSPLIIIDGVPVTKFDINNISPYDVKSISVLKDAASTAIYGARAAFGVILITTKKGSQKGINVKYNNYFGFSKATVLPEVYDNPVDYLKIANEFNKNIGATYYTDAQLAYPEKVANDPSLPHAIVKNIGGRANLLLGGKVYDYYKIWLRKYTPKSNHHLSLSGEAGNKFKYFTSLDFNHEEGNIEFKPAKVNRYTLRSNISYEINSHIKIFNRSFLLKKIEDRPKQYLYDFTSNIYRMIENSNAMMPEYVKVNGKMVPTDLGFYKEFVAKQSGINKETHDFNNTFGVNFTFLNNALKIHGDYSYQFISSELLKWWNNKGPYLSNSFNNRNVVLPVYSDAGPPETVRNWSNTKHINVNAYATYNLNLGKNKLTILGGYNQERYSFLSLKGSRENPLEVPEHSLNLATGTSVLSDDDDRNASRSIFSRINYNFNNKYLLELDASYFSSSKFTKGKRGHPFLAASVGWRISEENFFKPLQQVLNNLKLRLSYGSIGNENIGSYDYLPIMSVRQSSYTLEAERVNYTTAPNPKSSNFTWETVKSFDIGLDFSVLNNRLTSNFDYYIRNTVNMLAYFRSLPSVFGAPVPKENIASLRNKGWELNLNWRDNFTLGNDDFNYSIRFNMSDYSAIITKYYNPTNFLDDYYVGQKIGEIWGLTTLGYFKSDETAKEGPLLASSSYKALAAAGVIKFKDINGDGTIDFGDHTLSNPGDYKIIGNSTPRYKYGITLSVNWKGFDFYSFFRGIGKRDIYPISESVAFWGSYNRKYQVLTKFAAKNRWTPDNPNAYFPRPQGYIALGGNTLGVPQTKYLQNAAFIRLKSLTLGYTIPKLLTKKIGIESLRIYLTGQNLWEVTKLNKTLDPEGLQKDPDASSLVGYSTIYPIQRIYAFGLQVQF